MVLSPATLVFRRMQQHCLAVKLQKCFVDYETSQDFPLAWGRGDNDRYFISGVKLVPQGFHSKPTVKEFKAEITFVLSPIGIF